VFPIMFKTGQALPLVFTRILRPRIGRGDYARQPRDIHRLGPRTRQIRELEQSQIRTHTHTIRVREPSVSARSPRPQTRSHTGHSHELITDSQVREQAFAGAIRCPQVSPRSRTVHISELVTNQNCLWTSTSRTLSALAHSRFHAVSDTFPGSHSN
jgi:hypothetical protein